MKRFFIISVLVLVLLSPCHGRSFEKKQNLTVAVVVNFYPEIEPFLARLENPQVTTINNIHFYEAMAGDKRIILFMSGADQAAAASGLQLAIERFQIDRIIVCGLCGGVSPEVHPGDVIIPSAFANHTFAYLAPDKRNFAPFFKPLEDFPAPYGHMYHDMKELNKGDQPQRDVSRRMWFDVDPDLLEKCRNMEKPALKKLGDKEPRVIVGGRGVSGSWFVDNYQYRMHLYEYFKADSVDIESQAMCQVAFVNDIPILVVRAVSDYAGSESGEKNTVSQYLYDAARNSSEFVWELIKQL